ncbi:MAG TPA: bifunctional phosphoserine phosphatase/homoserine phosphotransferase ThrH [Candidatus Eisenbacteria bacterium]|jgi:phosphoserine/homoserine phosphotransferase
MIFSLDLEGVLAPEIWPVLAAHFGVPEFSLTTRDIADFEELMRRRVGAATRERLKLADLQRLAHAVEPFLGAREFLARLRMLGNVVIISDTFHEFSEPLVAKLGHASLFANRFELDAEGHIKGFKLRIRGQKERIVSGFKSAGYKVAAMGDSLNDLSLLKSCDYPVLYRPVERLAREFPGVQPVYNLDDALALLEEARRRVDENGGN